MLVRLFLYMVLQTIMQALSQVTLKVGLQAIHDFEWTWSCIWNQVLTNWWLMAAIILIIGANLFWFYILKYFPFSYAYPLTALGFVFGLVLSIFILKETVVWTQWVGVMLIMGGCFFLLR